MINAYYVMEDGNKTGPFTHHELTEMGIKGETMVLSPLNKDWMQACDLSEFNDYFESDGFYFPYKETLANFWWRLLAYLIDYILVMIFVALLVAFAGVVSGLTGIPVDFESKDSELVDRFLSLAVLIIYNGIFEATEMRGSIGKKICKLMVVNINGQQLSFGTALARNAGKLLSSLVCGFGFLTIIWDANHQAWHDQLAKTYVIRKVQ
jgi:uncharacterized RDD family membrane protein YckC